MVVEDLGLAGQVAVVTGGGRGLGCAIAQALAHVGVKVAIVARSEHELKATEKLIHDAGDTAVAVKADVTDWDAMQAMAQTVEKQWGAIDILVNNAGITGTPGPVWEADPKDWLRTMEVNVGGAFLCTRAILPGMIQRQRGRIINMSSTAALFPLPNANQYSVSKAALLRFTDCLANDTQAHGISVFAVDPGTVRTAMTEYLMESEAGRTHLAWFRDYVLKGNEVPATFVANLILQLASGKADRLSGRFIQVSDDLEKLIKQADQIQHDDLYSLRLRKL